MAEKIIIDGYNLIGTHHKDIKAQRERLIQELSAYGRRKGFLSDMTLVFDGLREGLNTTTTSIAGLQVIYSARGQSADDVIKNIIARAGISYIVITSDRDIASFAWSKNCTPVRSEAFSRKLYVGDFVGETDFIEEEDDDKDTAKRKGNPRILSKKDKMIKQALDKL
ncbi:MAG: NYN domain-containing protein [Candidatus Magnetominusculus sp. LBB02]|nr:NYN domain-containing protein [Candidatus Magnetominusculus sp. LBB02]